MHELQFEDLIVSIHMHTSGPYMFRGHIFYFDSSLCIALASSKLKAFRISEIKRTDEIRDQSSLILRDLVHACMKELMTSAWSNSLRNLRASAGRPSRLSQGLFQKAFSVLQSKNH